MTRYYSHGGLQDALAVQVQRRHIRAERVFKWPGRRPPQVRKRYDSIRCSYQRRDILRCMAWRLDQAYGGRELVALSRAALPVVSLIDRPVIMETCPRKERSVERVVWMMMREDHIGNIL